jgi:hypothetical protein
MRTSLYSILCIGIRLAAVLLAVNALLAIPATYAAINHGEWGQGGAGWLAVLWGVVLLFALGLWVYPGVLARLAAGKASQQIFESPISADELQQIAFSVVGLWILLAGLIGLVELAMRELLFDHVLFSKNTGLDSDALRERIFSELLMQVIRMVVGSAVLFRAHGIVGLLRTVRERGLPSATTSDIDMKDKT